MLSSGFNAQSDFLKLENYTRMVFTLFTWRSDPQDCVASKVDLIEKLKIALENVMQFL